MTVMLKQYKAAQNRVMKATQELEMAETSLKIFEKNLRARVQLFLGGETVTLVFEGRELKCVKNMHNRYRVSENKKVIDSDYMGTINDLRLTLAIGAMGALA